MKAQTVLLLGLATAWAITSLGQDQNVRPPAPLSATLSDSTNIPHAAYVDRLLADGRTIVPYAERTPLNSNDIGILIARYREIPSVTNKWGIALALAHRGDERVVDLFWNTLTKECAGRSFQDSVEGFTEGVQTSALMRLMGLVAARSQRAFTLLRNGVVPAFWQTNAAWRIAGEPATRFLVECCIEGLACSQRADAWQVVLDLKAAAEPAYLRTYSGTMVDAAFLHYRLAMGGWQYLQTNRTSMIEWQRTPEGRAWEEWFYRVSGIGNMPKGMPDVKP